MTRKPVSLSLEQLDDRAVPSVSQPTTEPPAAMQPIAIVHPTHPLTGRGTGTFQSKMANPDTGTTHTVRGTAELQGMGKVIVNGDIHGPGFINSNTFTGKMTFQNLHGKVTVQLTSFRPSGPAGLPIWYRYQVIQATGTFKGMHDTGSLRLDVQLFPSFAAGPSRSGTFRVTI
jgi:hypothetical protein